MARLQKNGSVQTERTLSFTPEDILKKLSHTLPPTPTPGTASKAFSYLIFTTWQKISGESVLYFNYLMSIF